MRPFAFLILRLWCSLALIVSTLPARAGTVCVEGGRIVASCPMAMGHDGAGKRACCRSASEPPAGLRCPSRPGARCADLYRVGGAFVDPTKAKAAPILSRHEPVALASPQPGRLVEPPAEIPIPPALRPPSPRPYVPDRGRAPPET